MQEKTNSKVDDDDCADSQETYMVYVLIEKIII